jgi:hypothetical protein
VARRVVRVSEYAVTAAGQYLSAIAAIRNPHERRRVVALFREAADHVRQTANYVAVERFLAASTSLLDAEAVSADDPVRAAIEEERHAALYSLGRHQEADELYTAIERRCEDPLHLVDAACVQVSSLCARGRPREAVAFGLDLLRRLGLTVPNDIEAEMPRLLRELQSADAVSDEVDDLQRPEASDPRALAIANLINRIVTPAYLVDPPVLAWIVLESQRLWAEHGPCAAMVATTRFAAGGGCGTR